MKNPPGYGSIDRMKGNRRKPYRVRITTDYTIDGEGRARQIQRTLGTYATYQEAVDALAAYNRNPVALDAEITFAEVYRQYMDRNSRNLAPKTVQTYASAYAALEPLYDRPFRKLRRADLQRVIDDSGRNFAMLSIILAVMRNMYSFALRHDLVDDDYSTNVDIAQYRPTKEERETADKLHKPFTDAELTALWAAADKDPTVREILALCYSGLRIMEYLSLTPNDIDTQGRIIALKSSKTPAGIRRVPIAKKTAEFWAEIKASRTVPDSLSDNQRYRKFVGRMDAALKSLGLPQHRPHDTRHTAASMLHRAGVDLLTTKRILGHSVRDITERVYTATTDAELLSAIDKI